MSILPAPLLAAAQALIDQNRQSGTLVATAESCTGGLVSAALTSIAGSSAVLERGFVTYSNQAKTEMLGVPAALIQTHGAVSSEVAEAMAVGALHHSNAHRAVAITGIAGPGGGSPEKPVGLVHFAMAATGQPVRHRHFIFPGERDDIRLAAALTALDLLRG
ncbi:CinA family protein [Magnetospirillum sulfuroxidans]|uniref:Nicotinamide-nucleotide amidohydrolase family protein n=1 Tax=Magnetospirillum sulfuroxidans TaxID=611300 RepID=A0ABS5I7N9_9PROT|nr:nicotinamide-nucleotide amidohydrolase family protein [Magnetospirillum sulfuroxidans]MBR9970450.1 nicotinamide-nucleotide amidohydrolase family protein [Magnetospirillum sulfuroxidans]